jgi:hypothetical protein
MPRTSPNPYTHSLGFDERFSDLLVRGRLARVCGHIFSRRHNESGGGLDNARCSSRMSRPSLVGQRAGRRQWSLQYTVLLGSFDPPDRSGHLVGSGWDILLVFVVIAFLGFVSANERYDLLLWRDRVEQLHDRASLLGSDFRSEITWETHFWGQVNLLEDGSFGSSGLSGVLKV